MKFTLLTAAILAQSLLTTALPSGKPGVMVPVTASQLHAKRAPGKAAIMVPVDEYHPVLGRRSVPEERLSEDNLEPRQDLLLQWMTQSEVGSLYKASMNITSDDGTKLLFMNKFQDFTAAVDCTTRDGDGLSITFKKPEYLEKAKKHWGWLTEDSGRTFWIIANHKDCAKDPDHPDEYIPYKITDVDYDGLTAEFVKSERKTMKEALSYFNFELNFGKHRRAPMTVEEQQLLLDAINELEATGELSADADGLAKRWDLDWIKDGWDQVQDTIVDPVKDNLIDPVKEKFNKWGDKLVEKWDKLSEKLGDKADALRDKIDDLGNFSDGDKWDFDVNKDFSNQKLTWDMMESNELWCSECYSKGKFVIEGKWVMEKMDLKEASYSIVPEDFSMKMKLNAKLQQQDWTKLAIQAWSIPFTPVEIPYIFHLGPEFRLDLDLGRVVNSAVDFNFGWEASVPQGAYIRNNVAGDNDVQSQGFDGEDNVRSLPFELNQGIVDIGLHAAVVPTFSFGYEILGLGGYEAAIKAPLPEWTGNFTTVENEEGACEPIAENPDASKLAIESAQSLKAALKFYVGPVAMFSDPSKTPLVDKELFSWEKTFEPECIPIRDNRKEMEEKLIAEDPELGALDQEEKEIAAEVQAAEDELAALEAELAAMEAMTDEELLALEEEELLDEELLDEELLDEELLDDELLDGELPEMPMGTAVPTGVMPTGVPVPTGSVGWNETEVEWAAPAVTPQVMFEEDFM